MKSLKSPCVLYVSSFPPRECGIATFTSDLTGAIDREFSPAVKSKVMAMNVNGTSIYNYPRKVSMQLSDTDLNEYLWRANKINKSSDIKLINIQHEYGLFGGDWGNYLLAFLEVINKPKVITFHTILPRPRPDLKKLTYDLIDKVDGVVVMTKSCKRMLQTTYGVPKTKPIFIIPHGVQNVAYPSKTRAKKIFNLQGRTVFSTFGMLNSDKGLEYAIEALPEVVEKYPNVLYLILGATHPLVAKHEGEKYRNKLIRLVKKLKLEDNVKFYNKYMTLEEKVNYLKATDVYISPTLNPKQAVSGTVSDALACACPIVVTKNQYAKDVINKEIGILVDFHNSDQIKRALLLMMDDVKMTKDMKKAAYYQSRHMTWPNVAMAYFEAFNKFAKILPRHPDKLPMINLNHIRNLTDSFGMIQFASHTKPDTHSGYCLDDNVRSLIGVVQYYDKRPTKTTFGLIQTYLNYIKYSQKADGSFHDFVNYNRSFNDEQPVSEDSFGRAIWSLGIFLNSKSMSEEMIKSVDQIFSQAKQYIGELKFSRAIAFALLGLCSAYEYYQKHEQPAEDLKKLIEELVERLVGKYDRQLSQTSDDKWLWFDDHLTYSNYKIPEALFRSYQITKNKKHLKIAKESINFLSSIAFDKGYYNAIGQDGWYFRNGKRAYFDQQPEDAASATEALVLAWEVTKLAKYADQAQSAFGWFLGKNHLGQMVYDEATGGCYDGLGKQSINFNQGAESTICYFLARLAVDKINKK